MCVHQWPHVASDCPLTQDDQDVLCSVKVVRSVVAAMSSAGSSGWVAGRGDAICRSFNAGSFTYLHCRFRHECSSWGGSHPEVSCGRPRPHAGGMINSPGESRDAIGSDE